MHKLFIDVCCYSWFCHWLFTAAYGNESSHKYFNCRVHANKVVVDLFYKAGAGQTRTIIMVVGVENDYHQTPGVPQQIKSPLVYDLLNTVR
jgi:hypothetical protein